MSRLPLAALAIITVAAVAACSSSSSAPGWTYAPAPSVTPAPSGSASAGPSASAAASAPASAAPSTEPSSPASAAPSGGGAVTLTVTAPQGAATAGFDPKTLEGPANTAFTVTFDNQDTQTSPHNWVLKDPTGAKVQIGGDTSFFSGPAKRDYQIPALAPGAYSFLCEVHPAGMTGTLTIK